MNKSWSPIQIFFMEFERFYQFQTLQIDFEVRILRSFTRLFIILVSLMMSLFSEKMLISNECISDLMFNLIKKLGESGDVKNIETKLKKTSNLFVSNF